MKPSLEQLENLLALRRDEHPGEGYWQDFLCEFHHRQREQVAAQSGAKAFFAKISAWFSDMSPSKWAYSAGLAYASVTVAFFLMPKEAELDGNLPVSPVNYQVVPATAPTLEQLDELNLNPSSQGTAGEQVF